VGIRKSIKKRISASVGAVAVALVVAVPARAHTATPATPACTLGRLPASLMTMIPEGIAGAQKRFAASLESSGEADRRRAERAFATGVAAYLYGMPTVLMRLTVERFPLNALVGVGQLATPESRTVVAPNHDTLYSVSHIELGTGPTVIDAPATGGRYSVVQLLDAYSNAFAYVGSGPERDRDQSVALVPPGWQGEVPAGVRVVRSPTKLVWLLGRTLVDGPDDVAAAKELMGRYSLTPLADWIAGRRRAELVIDGSGGGAAVEMPTGVSFYDALGAALAADPPPAEDSCAVRAFASVGIGPGQSPSTGADPVVAGALAAAQSAGERLLERAVRVNRRHSRKRHGGWGFSAADTARFGTDYAYRAVVARVGLGANTRDQAFYPQTDVDDHGRKLDGRHDYVVAFSPGELPPVRAFWSLTLYDQDRFLVANPLERYSIGDRTAGLRYGRRGSLKIYVQHEAPTGSRAANWLPAPDGRFELHLRLYEPKSSATDGTWIPPTISRVR
jgi:hypothetical protein